MSYGAAGQARRARMVGRALQAAPRSLGLPWHRVLAAGGRIALPPRSAARAVQARRLQREGLIIRGGRVRSLQARTRTDLDALLWGAPRC